MHVNAANHKAETVYYIMMFQRKKSKLLRIELPYDEKEK